MIVFYMQLKMGINKTTVNSSKVLCMFAKYIFAEKVVQIQNFFLPLYEESSALA